MRGSLIERARQRLNTTVLNAEDVLDVLGRLRDADVRAWLIGGWAVDALLGDETRVHGDLDLVVEADSLERAREVLERAGFELVHEVPAGRWLSVQVKMMDRLRRSVSLHPIDVGAWSAPAGPASICQGARELGLGEVEDVFASGRIAGREVPSLSAVAQITLHCGYEIRDRDREDVAALCRRFALPSPLPYRDDAAETAVEGR